MKPASFLADRAARRAAKAEAKVIKARAKLAKSEAKLEARRAKLDAAEKIYKAALAEAERMGAYAGEETSL